MTLGSGVWRSKLWWWLPALVFLGANLILLSAYRLVYAGQSQLRLARIERGQTELAELRQRRQRQERDLERLQASREAVDAFYLERLASEDERLTAILAEVRELADRAGLRPTSFRYGREEIEAHGLLRRSIEFNVEGSYLQFRRLVNMLELTDSFLVLEEVSLRGSDDAGKELRIGLRLSTLFADSGSPPRQAPVREVRR